ncbi:hypothetical protein GCM10019017_36660 [Streptomyces showdoensis]
MARFFKSPVTNRARIMPGTYYSLGRGRSANSVDKSGRARKVRSTRTSLVVFAVLSALTSCAAPGVDQVSQGDALTGPGDSAIVGSEHAKIGQYWWFALPMVQNQSDSPVKLTGVQVLDPPKGLQVIGYTAFSSAETRGVVLISPDGDPAFPTSTYKGLLEAANRDSPRGRQLHLLRGEDQGHRSGIR